MDSPQDHSSVEIEGECTTLLEKLGSTLETYHAVLVSKDYAIKLHKLSLGLRLWRDEVFDGARRGAVLDTPSTRKLVWSLFIQAKELATDIDLGLQSPERAYETSQIEMSATGAAESESDALIVDIDSLEATLRCLNDLLPSILYDEDPTEFHDSHPPSEDYQAAARSQPLRQTDSESFSFDTGKFSRKTILSADLPPSPASTSRRTSIDEVLFKPQAVEEQPPVANLLDPESPYRYSPLQYQREIRLLKLYPAVSSDEGVTCQLEHVLLPIAGLSGSLDAENGCPYEALSWVWSGDRSQSISIVQGPNRRPFVVDRNLHTAFVALRHKDRPRYLWIDAICINQSDHMERNAQVPQMFKIFSGAVNVCVWLGSETSNSAAAFSLITEALEVNEFETLLTRQHLDAWTALIELMRGPWFRRRWVIQEIASARRATIHCGHASVKWEDFAASVSLLNDIESSTRKLSELSRRESRFDPVYRFFREIGTIEATVLVETNSRILRRTADGQVERLRSLEDLVGRLTFFETLEPRDVIYAVLALAKDTIAHDSDPAADIPESLDDLRLTNNQRKSLRIVEHLQHTLYRQKYLVDYSLHPIEVYRQFIAFAISRADPIRALDVICRPFAPKDDRYSYLPTWIPCLSDSPYVHNLRTQGHRVGRVRKRGDPFVSLPDTTPYYSAAGRRALDRSKIRFRNGSSHYSMFVEGFVLDTLEEVHDASQVGYVPESWVRKKEESDRMNPDVFWRVLIANRGPNGNPPSYYQAAIRAAFETSTPGNGLDTTEYVEKHPSYIIRTALNQVRTTVWGRRLFQTSRGHLGLGPQKMLVTSQLIVCILYGCSVPVILRVVRKTKEDLEEESAADAKHLEELVAKAGTKFKSLLSRRRERQAQVVTPARLTISNSLLAEFVSRLLALHVILITLATNNAEHKFPQLFALSVVLGDLYDMQQGRHTRREYNRITQYVLLAAILLFIWRYRSGRIFAFLFYSCSLEALPPPVEAFYLEILSRVRLLFAGHDRELWWARHFRALPLQSQSKIDRVTTKSPASRTAKVQDKRSRVYYEFLGECYVHGMMNGEAIKWRNETPFSHESNLSQIFELR